MSRDQRAKGRQEPDEPGMRLFRQQPKQGAWREAVFHEDNTWHRSMGGHLSGKVSVVHDVYLAPLKTRAEAEAWVNEIEDGR